MVSFRCWNGLLCARDHICRQLPQLHCSYALCLLEMNTKLTLDCLLGAVMQVTTLCLFAVRRPDGLQKSRSKLCRQSCRSDRQNIRRLPRYQQCKACAAPLLLWCSGTLLLAVLQLDYAQQLLQQILASLCCFDAASFVPHF